MSDDDVSLGKVSPLLYRDVLSSSRDCEVSTHLVARTPRHPLVVGTMTIRSLAEPFGNEGRNPRRTIVQLLSKLGISSKARSINDRKNCIGRLERLLINLQIFQRFDDHAGTVRILRARYKPAAQGDERLTLLCHLRSGGFRWKLTSRFNNLRLPMT